ncbi:MgtC/SapB family protein [Acaricomes phytoseiuli]|uniref:MgtC/SapB family protein n=1 Tax=Acaricomes phytoseiuli TaxID=291968 RepID=UPI002222F793|nr:MgtC/SapB family protein [Acaricomes phytoseiuli]MCW1248976.1 MgtC/SapB family protein [Acaricomes phytoseiuli]
MNEWVYLLNLALAMVLSLIIGVEREYHQKNAGIRTHILVGLGAALFMVISKYGFFDLASLPGFSFDGSRMAAQIITGVGFLGAGLILIQRNAVRGLTTAASIWLVAAVGTAAGAGMYIVAAAVTVAYLLVTLGIPPLARRMPRSRYIRHDLRNRYREGDGLFRQIVAAVAEHGMKVSNLEILKSTQAEDGRYQDIVVAVDGEPYDIDALVLDLHGLAGVDRIGFNREPEET